MSRPSSVLLSKGFASPEAGNRTAAGCTLVSILTLRVRASDTAAVLPAVLVTLSITLAQCCLLKKKEVIWGLIASLLIANFALLAMNVPMNVPMIKVFIKILEVPPEALMPTVTMI
jgi:putative tricarboxylic transport membrane protein